ncbi:HAMP domain-containing histidine kinase [Thiomicrospira aerophila]|nr:HAMP domain-containing histidine kinase [Thiomicrospira aerophila]
MLVVILLALLPLLVIKFSLDIQNQQLSNQISDDLQRAKTLSLLLSANQAQADYDADPIELWAANLARLHRDLGLDPDRQAIWLLNHDGQVFYVYGWLNPQPTKGIQSLWQRLLFSANATYRQKVQTDTDPVRRLVAKSLAGQTGQAIRQEGLFPASLMTSAPIRLQDPATGAQHQGVIIFEQTLTTLLDRSVGGLYPFILGLMLLLVTWSLLVIALAAHVSWRIQRVQRAVKEGVNHLSAYNQACYSAPKLSINDEIQQLNDGISQLFDQLSSYQRYLNALPSTLNHELHNPLNRLNLALARLPITQDEKKPLQQAIAQITHITQRLTEAQNLKSGMVNTALQPLNIAQRLDAYFAQVIDYIGVNRVNYQPFKQAEIPVMADGFLLEQLFDKLIDNALAFDNGQCPIQICCQLNDQTEVKTIAIHICNTGPNWPTGVDPRNEFFSQGHQQLQNPDGKIDSSPHLGLGLHLADLIAKRHQGELKLSKFQRCDTDAVWAPTGVCVTVILPCLAV